MESKVFNPFFLSGDAIDVLNEKKEHLEKQLSEIDNLINESELNYYNNLTEYISSIFGKFINIKMYYSLNGKSDSDESITWVLSDDINIVPHRYVESNGCLFGICCHLNNDYVGGVKDSYINLSEKYQKHKIVFTEITEKEFMDSAFKSFYNCLETRLKIRKKNLGKGD